MGCVGSKQNGNSGQNQAHMHNPGQTHYRVDNRYNTYTTDPTYGAPAYGGAAMSGFGRQIQQQVKSSIYHLEVNFATVPRANNGFRISFVISHSWRRKTWVSLNERLLFLLLMSEQFHYDMLVVSDYQFPCNRISRRYFHRSVLPERVSQLVFNGFTCCGYRRLQYYYHVFCPFLFTQVLENRLHRVISWLFLFTCLISFWVVNVTGSPFLVFTVAIATVSVLAWFVPPSGKSVPLTPIMFRKLYLLVYTS